MQQQSAHHFHKAVKARESELSARRDELVQKLQHEAAVNKEELAALRQSEAELKGDLQDALSYRKKCFALKEEVGDLQGRLNRLEQRAVTEMHGRAAGRTMDAEAAGLDHD
jgi:predicted  nucleic acid-binding Zn-ribbon protein